MKSKNESTSLQERSTAFIRLGQKITAYLNGELKLSELATYELLNNAVFNAELYNPWFTMRFIRRSLKAIAQNLSFDSINEYVKLMEVETAEDPKRVGVVLAGNIPFVGFHDFFSVIMSGNIFVGKPSSNDKLLMPALSKMLTEIEPKLANYIVFEQHLMKNFDAVIATGSNNSARYFEYYFGRFPNIIRKNRNSVAVLYPGDDVLIFKALADDIFSYFGLGCRNVSKLFLPANFNIVEMLDAFSDHQYVSETTKYFNNYEYNKSIMLVNRVKHLDCGFLLLTEDSSYASPISVLHYEYYDQLNDLENRLILDSSKLQCVVSSKTLKLSTVYPGDSQKPSLLEFADNVDVMRFLETI